MRFAPPEESTFPGRSVGSMADNLYLCAIIFRYYSLTGMSKALARCSAILLVALWGVATSLSAQDNPYKISNHLYALYQKGLRVLRKPECLFYADSLYRQAHREGDTKAECMGAVLRMRHFTQLNSREDMEREVLFVQEVSRRTGFDRYYYYAYQLKAVWLLNHSLSLAALQMTEQMKREAYADNSSYGIYNCLRIMGMIYYVRSNPRLAADYYRQALDYILKNLPEQSPSDAYFSLATCYAHNTIHDLKQGLENAIKAEETALVDMNRIKAIELQCEFLYKMERHQEFLEKYKQVMELYRKTKNVRDSHYYFVQVYYHSLLKQYDTALIYTDSIFHPSDRLLYKAHLCERMGNYQQAFKLERRRQSVRDSLTQELQSTDLAELTKQLETEMLKQENIKLDLKNSELQLQQMQQQVALEKSKADNQELALHNRDLELMKLQTEANMKQLEADRQRLENERQKEIIEQQRLSERYHSLITSIIIGVMLLILCLLALYLWRRWRLTQRLSRQNEELQRIHKRLETALHEAEEAQHRAEEADRMKSMFIQNMSHEIRTPLNSIVGFSQLLTDPNLELDGEQRGEFSQLIIHNSDLLTTLVNDILALSELESGNYQMKSERVVCNTLCRESLNTVSHRCPEGVQLRFTSEVADDYTIQSDGQRIKQVLINYLTNAEKYTEKGEIHLHLSLTEHPGHLTFSVADTGRGIPADQAEAIFERFRKLDNFVQGTGLGLNICRLIAEHLQGEVSLDTSYTRGARFLFILPL